MIGKNLTGTLRDIEIPMAMKTKSVVQQYNNNRKTDNRLTGTEDHSKISGS